MFDNIHADFCRYYAREKGQSPLGNKLRILLSNHGFYATVIYRFGRWIEQTFAPRQMAFIRYILLLFHRALTFLVIKMYRIDIDRHAIIGKGLYISHFVGIEIKPCRIGEFCSLYQHVKIGETPKTDNKETIPPQIGSYVWIGPYSKINNNVTIGNHATISAGTLITEDLQAHHFVAGVPTRILSTSYDNHPLLHLNSRAMK